MDKSYETYLQPRNEGVASLTERQKSACAIKEQLDDAEREFRDL